MSEKINPEYYKNKKIETYEAIVSQLSPPEVIGGLRWQMLKYIMRFGEKHGSTISASIIDISKANWYSEKLLQYLTDLEKQGYKFETPDNVAELFKEKQWRMEMENTYI